MWTQHYIHFPYLASHSALLIAQIIPIAFFPLKSFRNRGYIAQRVIFNVTKSQLNLNLALVCAVCTFYWEVLFCKVPSALCTLNTHTCHLSSHGPLISVSFWFAFIFICIDTPQKSNVMLHLLLSVSWGDPFIQWYAEKQMFYSACCDLQQCALKIDLV